MNKGDLVIPIDSSHIWEAPGVIIKGPYGSVEVAEKRYDGKVTVSFETKVVDILIGRQVFTKIPIEKLKVLR